MTRIEIMAVPQAQPAPPARAANDPAGTFAAIAALGALFAGFVSHSRNPDLLATALAAGIVFFAAWIAMYVVHVVLRATLALLKFAIPVAAVLLVGCALDWAWAETAVHWLRAVAEQGIAFVGQAWAAARAQ
jgi:hypothetical protein